MNPLDQLADISIPTEVSPWPPAIGYWLVLGVCVALIVAVALLIRARKAKHKARKLSLEALNSIDADDPQSLQHIHHVLKTATQQYFVTLNVLQMQGIQWTNLVSQLYPKRDTDTVIKTLTKLAQWQYDQRIDMPANNEIKAAAQTWLKSSLPPKSSALALVEKANSQTNKLEQEGAVHV